MNRDFPSAPKFKRTYRSPGCNNFTLHFHLITLENSRNSGSRIDHSTSSDLGYRKSRRLSFIIRFLSFHFLIYSRNAEELSMFSTIQGNNEYKKRKSTSCTENTQMAVLLPYRTSVTTENLHILCTVERFCPGLEYAIQKADILTAFLTDVFLVWLNCEKSGPLIGSHAALSPLFLLLDQNINSPI